MVVKSRFLTAEAVRNDNLIRAVWAQLKPVCMTHAEGSNDGDAVSVQRSFASVGMTWELVRPKAQARTTGAATLLGSISPMRRIWAPTPRSFSSMCS